MDTPATCTPFITFSVNSNQFNHLPIYNHTQALYWIMHALLDSLQFFIVNSLFYGCIVNCVKPHSLDWDSQHLHSQLHFHSRCESQRTSLSQSPRSHCYHEHVKFACFHHTLRVQEGVEGEVFSYYMKVMVTILMSLSCHSITATFLIY